MNTVKMQKVDKNIAEPYGPEPMPSKLEKMIARVEYDIARGTVSKKFSYAQEFLADLKV